MATTRMHVAHLGQEVKYGCALGELVVRLSPPGRGNWVFGTLAMKVLSRKCRGACVSLSWLGHQVNIELDLRDPPQFSMVKNKRFDEMTASVVRSALREGDVFMDVGANWGYFSCIAAQRVGTAGLIVAIEPNRQAHRRLQDTVGRHELVNVLAVNSAAYDSLGERVSLFRPLYRQTTSSYVRRRAGRAKGNVITTTLDYLWRNIGARDVRLIKVDTEGAELLVMRGAHSLLTEVRPLCVLEASSYCRRFGYALEELYGFMRGLGYSRAYLIRDGMPEWPGLAGPVREVVEGQILFCHEDEKLVVA